MLIDLKYKNKTIDLEGEVCKWKFLGLMFTRRENAKALLFDFKKPTRISIHSLFVFFPFLAIWMDNENNILEVKKVFPWNFSISPKKKFSRLVEIPCNSKYKDILKSLDGDGKPKKSRFFRI